MAKTAQRRAKQPVTKLAGPYGHPFHPMLVTVPIGAWVLALIFDIASFFAGDATVFVKMAFWATGVGILGAVAAAIFGLLDLIAIPRGTRAFAYGLTHMTLNLLAVTLYTVSFALRRGETDVAPTQAAPLIISLVAIALLAASGWIGGELVYKFGVRVAADDVQAKGFEA